MLHLAKTAIEPEVIEQLGVWSVELADEADAAERLAVRAGDSRHSMNQNEGAEGDYGRIP